MNALSIFKSATEVVIAAGTGTIVGNVIKATTPAAGTVKGVKILRQLNQASVPIAGWFISGFIADAAAKHAVEKIEKISNNYSEIREAVQDAPSTPVRKANDKIDELQDKAEDVVDDK